MTKRKHKPIADCILLEKLEMEKQTEVSQRDVYVIVEDEFTEWEDAQFN